MELITLVNARSETYLGGEGDNRSGAPNFESLNQVPGLEVKKLQ